MKTRRKRTPAKPGQQPGALALGRANDLIQRKQLAAGLSLLNNFSQGASPLLQRRALALVADASLRRGDPLQAAQIFGNLARTETDPANWLRVSLGEVRAQLAAANFTEAETAALAIVQTARERELADRQAQAQLSAQTAATP